MPAYSLDEQLNALLSEREWIAGLARALVGDGAGADDLVQDTWLSALRYGKPVRAPRAFLRTVLRNRAKANARADARRREREIARGGGDPEPSSGEVAERFETIRDVATAIAELEEPFKTTVLSHYYDGLSLAEIARASDTAQGTVRWRLHRAHALMRAKLSEKYGEDKWRAAVLPLCALPRRAAVALSPLLAIAGVLAAAGIAILCAGMWFGWFASEAPEVEHVVSAEVGQESAVHEAATTEQRQVVVANQAEREQKPQPSTEHPQKPLAPQYATVRARFVDDRGGPIEGVTLRVVGARLGAGLSSDSKLTQLLPPAKSDADGRAVLSLHAGIELLRQVEPRWRPKPGEVWTLVLEAAGRHHESKRFDVQLAHRDDRDLGTLTLRAASTVSGTVVDAGGRGVAGAEVVLTYPPFPADCDYYARRGLTPSSHAKTKTSSWFSAGRFSFRRVPNGLAMVWAKTRGHKSAYAVVDIGAKTKPVKLELGPPTERTGVTLDGDLAKFEVVGPDDKPASGVQVCLASKWMSYMSATGADGRAEVGWARSAKHESVTLTVIDGHGRFAPLYSKDFEVPDGVAKLTLSKGRHFTVVARSTSGAPVSKFTASWTVGTSGYGLARAKTESGRAKLLIPPVPVKLKVDGPGFATCALELGDPDKIAKQVEVRLDPLAWIAGKVMAGGKPVAKAEVIALRPAGDSIVEVDGYRSLYDREELTRSGVDGSFRFDLEKRMRLRFYVRAKGFAPRLTDAYDFDPRVGLSDLEIGLREGAAIEGRVLDRNRNPVQRAVVVINDYIGHPRSVIADLEGRYRFDHLRAVAYALAPGKEPLIDYGTVSRAGSGGKAFTPWTNVTLREGETKHYDLLLGSCRVTGRIVAPSVDLRGWTVNLRRPGSSDDVAASAVGSDGRFSLATFQPDVYELSVVSAGGPLGMVRLTEQVELARGDKEADFQLRFGSLTGRAPANPGARSHELVWTGNGVRATIPVRVDDEGRFTAPLVPVGQVTLFLLGHHARKQVGVYEVR